MIKYIHADLLRVSKPSIIAHACNTRGSWGGGFAYHLAQRFPKAEEQYTTHCQTHENLLGTTLLIFTDREEPGNELLNGQAHVIACLFTSRAGGAGADEPEEILQHTAKALDDLKQQLEELMAICPVSMPRINSGIFRVPWESTEEVLKASALDYEVYVL